MTDPDNEAALDLAQVNLRAERVSAVIKEICGQDLDFTRQHIKLDLRDGGAVAIPGDCQVVIPNNKREVTNKTQLSSLLLYR
eukprot:COSAG06_NODE_3287_length_5552_cov_3.235283_3_plen_82_part_00